MTRRKQIWLGCLAAAVLLLTIAVGGAGTWIWQQIHRPFQGYAEPEVVVDVPRGVGATEILQALEQEGVVSNARLARLFLIHQLDDPPLKAGEYKFVGPLSTPEVLEKLIRGEVMTHPVTVIEGLTLEETAAHLAAAGAGDLQQFLALMQSNELIADLDPEATDLEGYLFPETYHFAKGTTEAEIVGTMVETFRNKLETEVLPLSPELPLDGIRELVTLASIVEKEALLDEERPTIAGVYANRLRRRIALHADPTVIFALKLLGTWDGNLRRDDLEVDSPYNTYRYPGLPPGPIASPGQASLQAAAHPAEVSFLYFVSRNDGSHVFADTLSEHNRNVYKWQKLYWRQRWAEERQQKESGQ